MAALALTCHPSVQCAYVRAVCVDVGWAGTKELALRYRVECDPDRLRVPPPRGPERTDDLWRHTCFEAFIKNGDSSAYLEANFSPSGEWALYRFDDYRHGMRPCAPPEPPRIVCRRGADSLQADVHVRLDGLLGDSAQVAHLRLNVAAVLEDNGGQLSYWALAHPAERPDFHHADSFVLSVPQLGVVA